MKKKIISLAAIAIVAVVAAVGVSKNANKIELSDLALANVEALAEYETGDVIVDCGRYEGPCWDVDWTSAIIGMHCYFSGRISDYCVE